MPGPISQSYEGPSGLVTCDGLRRLVEPHDNRTAVLILLRGVPGKAGEIQFVTWGRTAADKSEAHNLKEWVKNEVFDGEVPDTRTHESFILDAAKNKEELERLRAVIAEAASAPGQDWLEWQLRLASALEGK